MARQNNASYWAQRMKNMEDALLDHSYTYVENLDKQFAAAMQGIEKDIAVWYQRFADNNEISLADAKKWLTSGELKELQWTVDEYIKFGKENAVDGAWIKELENASAKVHISRLDALKLQIQQQAEVLHTQVEAATEKAAREIYEAGYYHTGFEVQKGIGLGWSLASIDEKVISKVLSRPWTIDGQTFRDRCWTNKKALVDSVNTHLTQMIIRGEAPDRTIAAIAKDLNVSKSKAGRLVMTESAHFATAAQKDCYNELDVEEYKIVSAIDVDTCELCGEMDGKVFKQSDFEVGLTAPPFHPWCRCCTAPYFADQEKYVERYAEDVVTGKAVKLEPGATYEDWKAMQNELHGEGTVEKLRTISYNEKADAAQLKKYQKLLGKKGNLRGIEAFQNLKYNDPDGYAVLKTAYADKKIQTRLQSNPAYTALHTGRQGKHILGHNNYTEGRSYLTISMDEAQELIKQYVGTGELKRDNSGKWTHKEFVTADRVIGYIMPLDGGEPTPTKRFSISYATGKNKGAHMVPARED